MGTRSAESIPGGHSTSSTGIVDGSFGGQRLLWQTMTSMIASACGGASAATLLPEINGSPLPVRLSLPHYLPALHRTKRLQPMPRGIIFPPYLFASIGEERGKPTMIASAVASM